MFHIWVAFIVIGGVLSFFIFFLLFFLHRLNFYRVLCVLRGSLFCVIVKYIVYPTEVITLRGNVRCDFLRVRIVCLSFYVVLMAVLGRKEAARKNSFMIYQYFLLAFMVRAFIVGNVFLFFFLFESVLVPLLLLVLGWGVQPERLQAATYMFIYTVFGSMMFLVGVRLLFSLGMSDQIVSITNKSLKIHRGLWWVFLLGFIIKLPLYPFHLWLPKAHVEAPVRGSIILAGVVLKLGGYGLIRSTGFLCVPRDGFSFHCFIWIALVGGIYAGFICLRQADIKSMVAYSSVRHIRLVWLVRINNSRSGVLGGILIMLRHGLCSSGLFRIVNLFYKESRSRLFYYNNGFLSKRPVLSILCFLLLRRNIGAPPSLNFFGEVLGYIFGMSYRGFIAAIMGIITFLGGGYRLYFFSIVCYSKRSFHKSNRLSLRLVDCFVLVIHWVPLNARLLVLPFI